MGRKPRPVEVRRRRVFDQGLAAAQRISSREGLGGLTARRIAAEVGCSVGTLYNVFGNMDSLILHLNGTTLDALYDEMAKVGETADGESADGESADSDSTVQALTVKYLEFTRTNLNLWNVIFEHSWPKDYPIPDWYHDKVRRLLMLVADALKPLFPAGDEAGRYQAATVLWSGLHGINSLSVAGKLGIVSDLSVTGISAMLTSNFIAGLQRQGPKDHRD